MEGGFLFGLVLLFDAILTDEILTLEAGSFYL